MGKLIVTEFITLDGVIEAPGGGEAFTQGGWVFKFNRGDEGDKFKFDELMSADAQLLGRVTYTGFARAWPTMNSDPFGEKMNSMPKYVVSTTLSDADATWTNSTVLRNDWPSQVARLKDTLAGDILVAGSGQLARGLAERGLVDEFRLMVFPTVLGSGKRLFTDGGPSLTMRLLENKPVGPDGVVVLTYAPVR
ncbi:MAG TPA: dihydrofolate reductase family protein [Chloroflexota bacterium]|jgi:dihydrofolate reductase|nr:dihydrofolate reductase family protein [Chloroflexota bacterium]